MTRRERIERRIERRRAWAASRAARAQADLTSARTMADQIPMGQPILVGHHSEKRHRRHLDRIDGAMRRGLESDAMAKTHASKAANLETALDRTIFSDDDNAAEALRARIAERTAQAERIVSLNKAIRREQKAGLTDGWLDRIGATEHERRQIESHIRHDWRHEPTYPPYVTANLRNLIRADQERIKAIETRTARQAAADAAGGIAVETSTDGRYASVTFAEKPARAILDALKAAGFHWSGGSWHGEAEKMPADVRALIPALEARQS